MAVETSSPPFSISINYQGESLVVYVLAIRSRTCAFVTLDRAKSISVYSAQGSEPSNSIYI